MKAAVAAPEDEARATFERFVAAQNAHDVKAVESLLLNSPDFLWITRGKPVWGPDAALKRFAMLYEGTWKLEPGSANRKVIMIRRQRCTNLCSDHIYNRSAWPTTAAHEISDRSAAGQDARRLESVEHPANTCACAITLARQALRWWSRLKISLCEILGVVQFSTSQHYRTRNGHWSEGARRSVFDVEADDLCAGR